MSATDRPRVSVGMPVYNGARWIRASLDSILQQTFPDFELIISDNASTDDTESICREYAAQDARVRYFRNDVNVGASDNYNAVFRRARGIYFKWASCNDICAPEFLARCVEVLEARSDMVLVYPRTRLMYGDHGPYEDYEDGLELLDDRPCVRFIALQGRLRLNNIMNGMIRTAVLARTPLIETYYSSDMNLMAELSLHGKFGEIPEFLFYRRMDPQSATKLKDRTEVRKHYDPQQQKLLLFQDWRSSLEYLRAPRRAGMPWRVRVCVYRYVLRSMFWDRRELMHDAWESMKQLWSRLWRRRAADPATRP